VNEGLLRAINRWPEWLAPTMRFFSEATNYSWFKVLLALLLLGLIVAKGRYARAAVQALIAFPLANGITDLFKHFAPHPRPFQELSDVILRAGWSDSAGTASAHSANMAAVAFVFTYHLGWWGSPWILVALLTGFSRIYNGVHYPYQVLLGWTCGCVAAFVVIKAWELILTKRNSVREENVDRVTDQEGQA
jgi:undecaprenyl-diphosphatase